MSGFKTLDRGFEKTLLLLPGWATDHRIFGKIDLPFNYILPEDPAFFDTEIDPAAIAAAIKLESISILGWSMGGFKACDIANKYPAGIDEVIFIGIRRRYDSPGIEKVRESLRKNRRAYLYKFYADMFSEHEKEGLSWFKRNLMKSYIDNMEMDLLMRGLDYLASAEMKPWQTNNIKVRFVHGGLDRIAPIEEAREAGKLFPKAGFVTIEGAGHAPFLGKLGTDTYFHRK